MSVTGLYNSWQKQVKQFWSDKRKTQSRMLMISAIGLFQARSVQLSAIAEEIPSLADETSIVRRLERFFDNHRIHVREWYRPVIQPIIGRVAATTGEIRLIVDGSKVGNNHQLLMVSLVYRRRSLPVAWTWIRCRKGHSSTLKQQALLDYVRSILPEQVPVVLVGDSEFGNVKLLRTLDQWQWHYVLRQKGSYLVQTKDNASWTALRQFATQPGTRMWLPQVKLTQKLAYPTNVLVYWAKGEEEPWLLATNLPTDQAARRAYKRRVWIEALFGDLKGKGFDLEKSRLQHFMRLSRLTLVVSIVYLWSIATGSAVVKNGQRHLVDRRDRRDLSLFQIGRRFIKRCLTNQLPLTLRLVPV